MAIKVVTSLNPLEENITFQKTPVSTKFYSSKILNYIESIEIAGFRKTVFYTELNTNLNVGDRVFIVNGNYDSGNFISLDKYTKYTDGYRVLGCDGCRLILDLDYTGELPYLEDNINKSIKVYNIENQREFDYINSIKINNFPISFTDGVNVYNPYPSNGNISKFTGKVYNLGTSSIPTTVLFSDSLIYTNFSYSGSTSTFNRNSGLVGTGFFVRDDTSSTPQWINVTTEVLSNKIRLVNPDYSEVENVLYINGENFTISSKEYKQRNTYTFDGLSWNLNLKYKVPYISKLNFRFGKFKGVHKDGIFGTNLKQNNWDSANWVSGAFINSIWNSGVMTSKSTAGEKSYYATLNVVAGNLQPVQTIDFSNNKGFGYNLVEDSTLLTGEIKNANIFNSNLGTGSTYSALNIYFGQTHSFGLKLTGLYNKCDIDNVISDRAKFSNSIINNSNLTNSELVNSQIINSTAKSSTFTDEEGINVIAADLWSYNTSISQETTIRGILKLYISDLDLEKVSIGDAFYLTKLNKNLFLSSLTGDQKIKLPIETKFIFDIYSDFELETGKVIVTIKNKNDNKVKTTVRKNNSVPTTWSNVFTRNTVNYASIDIESRAFGWYESTTNPTITIGGPSLPPITQVVFVSNFLNPIGLESINSFFTNTYLRNADFKNGYFDESNWKSGANIDYKHHVIPFNGTNLNISSIGFDTIYIGLEKNSLNSQINIPGEDLRTDDIVWLDSINHIDGNDIKSIAGRYRVVALNIGTVYKEVYLRNLEGLTFSISASYRVVGAENSNYNSIHKFRINNSQISSGLLVRTSLKSNTIVNNEFNNLDKNLDIQNIERLRLINILFKGLSNKVNSGYVFKSHFIDEIWQNGILYNSIWNGGNFQNGVFNSGYWRRGNFINGSFINSRDITSSTQSYDNSLLLYRTWLDGTFQLGEFSNSTWMRGTFSNGRFYNSEWFSGTWNNGILGSSNLKEIDTKMGYSEPLSQSGRFTTWNDGIVENAVVGGSGSVYWKGGKFNNGEFTSFGKTINNESIWYDGDFNNGKFTGLARWKNGKFFKGKFHSNFGLTASSPINPSTYSTSYAWEDGKFLGGEFGNASTGNNSVWYNGEFSGGIFQGRFWYKGLFTKGEFRGSGSASLIYNSNISNSGEYVYSDSFRTNYYGLWFSGIVSDNPKNVKNQERVFTELLRKSEEVLPENNVIFSNMLWKSGTFSHKNAILQKSLWLDGQFYDGTFDSSIFNPYVDRTFGGLATSSFASTSSCIWYGGKFDSTFGTGSFYISNWERGTFNRGYMSGAIWKNGVWNYGFADNILWLDGLWRNGNWNGAPFSHGDVDKTALPFKISDGRAKELILNVGRNLNLNGTIYLNNVFSASTALNILTDPNIRTLNVATSSVYTPNNEQYAYITSLNTSNSNNNPFGLNNNIGGSVTFYNSSIWEYGTTFSIFGGSVVSNSHVFTKLPTGLQPDRDIPESNKLYASINALSPNLNVFSSPNKTYVVNLQLTIEGAEKSDLTIKVGNKDEVKLTLNSNSQFVGGRIIYYPKQYNLSFIYTTESTVVSPTDTQFWIKKGKGGILRVLYLDIVDRFYQYHPIYNNSIVENSINFTTKQISLPNDSKLEVLATSDDGNLVGINIGNGLFKSGIWENGIWNNGYRSNSFIGEEDYFKFSDVVGLNGVTPYAGKGTYQIDSKTWLVTLQSIDTLIGLTIGDKVSIGNLVAIDINESRKLIKDYFTIKDIDLNFNTIVVELISNFPIIRVEKDSPNHLIYVTKNVWLTGAFLNGLYRGVWNNGLFKSYPLIGVIGNTHWVDGKLDGGRFISRKAQTPLVSEYQTGLIQNFTFIDNNSKPTNQIPKYDSWMDLNYNTSNKTTISEESANYFELPYYTFTFSFFQDNRVETSTTGTQLTGFITNDVLESTSIFKDSQNQNFTYKLGSKFTIYENLIPDEGRFLDAFSNNRTGLDLTNFRNDGWYWTDFGNTISFTSSSSPTLIQNIFKGSQLIIESNVDNLTKNKLRIKTSPFFPSAIVQVWTLGYRYQVRFAGIILNNENIQTERNRYYITNLNLATYSMSAATYSTNGVNSQTTDLKTLSDFNDKLTTSLTKTQYFFNRKDLSLNISASSTFFENGNLPTSPFPVPVQENSFDVIFNSISFWEVDMIPFFNYFGNESLIDKAIKTPWFAVAPFIDYSNSEFDFLGNVNLTIDSELVNNQVNYTLISAGGVSGTINTPPGTTTVVTTNL